MERERYKLASGTRVYKLQETYTFAAEDQYYALEEVEEPALLEALIDRLDAGISREEVAPEALELFDGLVGYLEQCGLLVREASAAKEEPFVLGGYLHGPLDEEQKALLHKGRVTLCGATSHPLADELEGLLSSYSLGFMGRLSGSSEAFDDPSTEGNTEGSRQLRVFLHDEGCEEQEVLAWNAQQVADGAACLYVDLSLGRYAWCGPLVLPGETACLACFGARREHNEDPTRLHAKGGVQTLRRGEVLFHPWQLALIAGVVAHEVLSYLLTSTAESCTKIVTIDCKRVELWREALLRYPLCPTCGLEQTSL